MKVKTMFAACRETKGEGGSTWFQTFPPYGRYPVGKTIEDAPEGAVFVFDEAAAKSVVEKFRERSRRADFQGVLVDREHFSTDGGKPSDAMAWAKDIRQEADGSIWTRWEFTPKGREMWETRTLVGRSPYFSCERDGGEYRPVELISIGMTNTPHFKELSNLAAARAADAGNNNNNKEKQTMMKILEALGLAEGASEDECVAAIQSLKDRCAAAETEKAAAVDEKKKCESKCRELSCDAFIAQHRAVIADEAACREVYMAAPEVAVKMFAACRKVSPAQTMLSGALSPNARLTAAKARETLASLPPADRAKYYADHKAEIDN